MKICLQCGVELEEPVQICPLCRYPVHKGRTDPKENSRVADEQQYDKLLSDYVKLTRDQKRKLFWELSGIILLSCVLITLIIDLVTSGCITWSRYSITVCLVLFANFTLLSFWRHKLLLMLGGSFISTSLLLVLLDIYNKSIGWGTKLGIPLLLSLYLIVFIFAWLIRITKQHGFNVLGYFFIAAGVLCVCTEGILSVYIMDHLTFRWSLIVFACMVPVAAILFFIHYRLNRGTDLRRFFHI
jgi:hypothetical protein